MLQCPWVSKCGGYKYGGSGGDGNVAGAMHLARHSFAEGGDSKVSGDGGGVGIARSLSTSVSGGRDIEVYGRIVILAPMVVVSVEGGVLTTHPACRPSLVSCLLLLGESLLSVAVTHGQSLEVLPSLPAVSESGSHVTAVVSGLLYSATVVVSGVSKVGTPVHILAHGGFEAHGVLSGLTLPI
nr:hypothetical protein [Tanacetum cinerariifolium]